MTQPRVVLVTGASTGIGRAIAEQLAADKHRVIGTSRRPESAAPVSGVELVALDVDDPVSTAACVTEVERQEGRIDVLVNNAGFLQVGALEELTIDEVRAQFDTNVFGVLRMAQAVLPAMRERRAGRIINVGSLSSTIAIPFGGAYTATKRALQGITESLRYEVRPFGVDVCLVEPGFVLTDAAEHARVPARPMPLYDQPRSAAHQAWQREIAQGTPVSVVAAQVAAVVRARRTRLRYGAGFDAWWMPMLRPFSPWPIVERLTARRFDLHRLDPVDGAPPPGSRID